MQTEAHEHQKIRLIETIEREIRPSLKHDGGDIEIIDIIGNRVIVALRNLLNLQGVEHHPEGFCRAPVEELISPDITVGGHQNENHLSG